MSLCYYLTVCRTASMNMELHTWYKSTVTNTPASLYKTSISTTARTTHVHHQALTSTSTHQATKYPAKIKDIMTIDEYIHIYIHLKCHVAIKVSTLFPQDQLLAFPDIKGISISNMYTKIESVKMLANNSEGSAK